jgi:small subunit ribosomal protein S20
MAHSRTAKKNIRKNERRRLANRGRMSALRTQVKRVREALEEKDGAQAQAELPRAQKLLDKAAKAGRMHPNKAARLKSRLARKADSLK